MTAPVRASDSPFAEEVEEGKTYWWCACGKSQSQPFCDGSHKGSEFSPVKYEAGETKKCSSADVKVQTTNLFVMVATSRSALFLLL